MQTQQGIVYQVVLIRTDVTEPITMYETNVKAEAIKCHEALDEEWANSVEGKRPFRIKTPFISSFAPTLCIEIKIRELTIEEYENERSYVQQQINEQGFSGFMNENFKR